MAGRLVRQCGVCAAWKVEDDLIALTTTGMGRALHCQTCREAWWKARVAEDGARHARQARSNRGAVKSFDLRATNRRAARRGLGTRLAAWMGAGR